MRLTHMRVQNYRCVRDTGWFDVEQAKTILVGAQRGREDCRA